MIIDHYVMFLFFVFVFCIEWLESRNKIPKEWQTELKQIQAKIKLLVPKLPLEIKSEVEGQSK